MPNYSRVKTETLILTLEKMLLNLYLRLEQQQKKILEVTIRSKKSKQAHSKLNVVKLTSKVMSLILFGKFSLFS